MTKKNSETSSRESALHSIASAVRSGGTDINADKLSVGGNVAGRDVINNTTVQQAIAPHVQPKPQFDLPFAHNPNLVGRANDLKQLHAALHGRNTNEFRPVLLSGMGGIGKTQLVVEYAWQYKKHYPDGIYWVNASLDLEDELSALGTSHRHSSRSG